MAKVFWDTNLFIYLFENDPDFAPKVVDLRTRMLERGDQLYTSALTVGEILVKPLADPSTGLASKYTQFFRSSVIRVLPFDIGASEHYARIKRDKGISRNDSIQLACAASAGVDLFITNDEQLPRKIVSGIQFIVPLDRTPL